MKKPSYSLQHIFFLLFLSILIIFLWFRRDLLFGAAEEGMPFYSPSRTLIQSSSPWQRDGTGYLAPNLLPEYPTMLFAKYLDVIFPKNVAQATIFFFPVFAGFIGAYLLAGKITHNRLVALISSLFYFFNLYTMSQVWQRAVYGLMFTWAFLPLFLFLWIRLLEGEKIIRWLVIFLVLQLVFSYAYTIPSNVFVFWVPALLYLLIKIIKERERKKRIILLTLISIAVGLLWLITNVWWIYPFIKLSGNAYSGSPSVISNLESLQGVSVNSPVSQIVQLRQKFFFNTQSNKETPWGTFYDSTLSILVSSVGFVVVLWGLIKLRKNKNFWFLFLLFVVALFVSKGTNPPLGYLFYKWLFSNFSFMEAFRNSYEKFGVVFLLSYSIFFGYGVFMVFSRFKKRSYGIIFLGSIFLTFFVYLTNPMWDGGRVFQKYFWIEVPKYYENANQFLNQDTSDSRILVLPTIPFHGIRYSWGYRGDEPSKYIFDKVAISKKLMYGYYADKYGQLSKAFKDESGQLDQILDELNVRYIILNSDIDWQAIGSPPPGDFKNILKKDKKIVFVRDFGNLGLYEYENTSPFDLFVGDGEKIPNISYKRLSHNHYKVYISGAKKSFNLIFKESFNNFWEAKTEGKKLEKHFLIYDYANAWNVDMLGDFSIDIIFKVWPWE